jgi:hypothetical protein
LTAPLEIVPGALAKIGGWGQDGFGVGSGGASMTLEPGTAVAGLFIKRCLGPAKFNELVRSGVLVPLSE